MWTETMVGKVRVMRWSVSVGEPAFIDRVVDELSARVTANPAARWVLDASAIPALGSEVIALLIGVVNRVRISGGRMVIAEAAPSVATVLRMTRLTKILPVYERLADAVAAVEADTES